MDHLRLFLMTMIVVVLSCAAFAAQAIEPADDPANIYCVGFDYPMDEVVSVPVKEMRYALPLRAKLYNTETEDHISSADLSNPPVVQVEYLSDTNVDPELVDDWQVAEADVESINDANVDNLFVYYPLSGEWKYNLAARFFKAKGWYKVTMQANAAGQYSIDPPTCVAHFVRYEDLVER